jgi:hypothetical protein
MKDASSDVVMSMFALFQALQDKEARISLASALLCMAALQTTGCCCLWQMVQILINK